MNVAILKKDIKQGEIGNPDSCPIALAVTRTTKAKRVLVGERTLNIDGVEYEYPRSVSRFVARFDREQKVTPFAFRLRKKA